ncbi:MAG: hypothetical protein Q9219_004170 [cf. Caloplaca sp. 3 TL-2023]
MSHHNSNNNNNDDNTDTREEEEGDQSLLARLNALKPSGVGLDTTAPLSPVALPRAPISNNPDNFGVDSEVVAKDALLSRFQALRKPPSKLVEPTISDLLAGGFGSVREEEEDEEEDVGALIKEARKVVLDARVGDREVGKGDGEVEGENKGEHGDGEGEEEIDALMKEARRAVSEARSRAGDGGESEGKVGERNTGADGDGDGDVEEEEVKAEEALQRILDSVSLPSSSPSPRNDRTSPLVSGTAAAAHGDEGTEVVSLPDVPTSSLLSALPNAPTTSLRDLATSTPTSLPTKEQDDVFMCCTAGAAGGAGGKGM